MNVYEKIRCILKDSFIIVILLSLLVQTVAFMSILSSSGASNFVFDINVLIYGKEYLTVLFSLVLISFTFLFKVKTRNRLLIIINIFYSILLLGDLWYYRGFQSFLGLNNLTEAKNIHGNLESTVFAMIRSIDMVFLVDNIIVIVFAILFRRKSKGIKKQKHYFYELFFIPIFVFIVLNLFGLFKLEAQFVPLATMRNLTPIGYHFYDIELYISGKVPKSLSYEEKCEIDEWIEYKNEKLPNNQYYSKYNGKNLIIIQVESLENFVVNQRVEGKEITPNINALLNNSLYFNNYYEQVNTGNSADADLMINASVLPLRRGSTFFRYPNNGYNTLADLLKDKGYTCKSLHAADGDIWNISAAFNNFGFDTCMDIEDFKTGTVVNMGVTDESFFQQVAELSAKDKQPFYYYTVSVSSHVPFEIPDEMIKLNLSNEFSDTAMGNYFEAINYADIEVGKFIKILDSRGILDHSLIVIVGDHSGVHKYYSDKIEGLSQEEDWWDNDYKVPLIIYNKDIKGKEINTIGGQVDFLPTIAYLMGVDEMKYYNKTMGRNILNTNKSYVILNDGTIRGGDGLTSVDITHINQSFSIADMILKYNYFK